MTDARSAWSETGEQLTALGSKLGAHFENQRGPDGESAREQTQEAIKRLGDAVKDAFDAVGAAARDEAVKQDVKQVGRSLVGALDVTFRQVSEEVRKAFDRSDSTSADAPAGPAPGSTAGSPAGGPAPGPAAEPTTDPTPTAAPRAEPAPGAPPAQAPEFPTEPREPGAP